MAMGSSQLCFASTQASDDATCLLAFPSELQLGFEAQTWETVLLVVLRPKPPNLVEKRIRYASSMISTRVTVILDRSITKFSSASAWLGQAPSWLSQHSLLLYVYSCLSMSSSVSYHDQYSDLAILDRVILLVDVPKCQQLRSVFRPSWSLSRSLMSILHHFQSIGKTHLYLTYITMVNTSLSCRQCQAQATLPISPFTSTPLCRASKGGPAHHVWWKL
jgi:hypothetical protein